MIEKMRILDFKKFTLFMNKYYLSQKNKDIQNQKETQVVILSLYDLKFETIS